jgi:hypothetical protein
MARDEIWNQICKIKDWPNCSLHSEAGLKTIRNLVFKEYLDGLWPGDDPCGWLDDQLPWIKEILAEDKEAKRKWKSACKEHRKQEIVRRKSQQTRKK